LILRGRGLATRPQRGEPEPGSRGMNYQRARGGDRLSYIFIIGREEG